MNIRARQKAATQASILQAALEIFSEQGFEGASTREIAAKAGVHHALIKYHFDNKDTLWRAAVAFLFKRQAEELQLPAPDDPAYASHRDFAKAVIRSVVLYSARHPEHARLMVQYKGNHGMIEMRKHLTWYFSGFQGAPALREQVKTVNTYDDLVRLIDQHRLLERFAA